MPTPVLHLPLLAGIAPAGLRREAATLALARKAKEHDWHILHHTTTAELPRSRLKSRHPYNFVAQEMLRTIPEDLSTEAWLAAAWKRQWESARTTRMHRYIHDPEGGIEGEDLPRRQWTLLNRLRTGVGRFKSSMRKLGRTEQRVSAGSRSRPLTTLSRPVPCINHPRPAYSTWDLRRGPGWTLPSWTSDEDTRKKKTEGSQGLQVYGRMGRLNRAGPESEEGTCMEGP